MPHIQGAVKRGPKTWKGVAGGIYTLVNTLPQWKALKDQLMILKMFAADTETTGFSFVKNHIIGLSFSWGSENSYYVPVRHETDDKQLDIEDIRQDLIEIFGRFDLSTIWHNSKFDLHFLRKEGIEVRGVIYDTLFLHKLLNENGSAELKHLSCEEIDPNADMWEVAIDAIRTKLGKVKIPAPLPGKPNRKVMRKKENVHYGLIDVDNMAPYAASDTHYTWALFKKKFYAVAEDPHLRDLFLMESGLLPELLDAEHRGVLINSEYLEKIGPQLDEEANRAEARVREYFDNENLNVNSAPQLIEALHGKGIRWKKKTPKNKPCLDVEVLENLATKYEVCADIVSCRKSRKLKTTYVDNILSKIDDAGYLHCSYNQNVVTGRMSSSNPNLQNITGKTDAIRKAFICPEDYSMLFIDYSQIEVRLTAHYSQDPVLLQAYTQRPFRDVHTNTMCEVFGHDYAEAVAMLSDDSHPECKELSHLRKVAKIINFLTIYGGGAKALKTQISTPSRQFTEATCEGFIRQYFEKLRVLKRWIGAIHRQVLEDLQVQNYFGRYRRFPILAEADKLMANPDKRWLVAKAKRQAVNFLIQGTCADLFKMAMVRVGQFLREQKAKSHMIMVIHDEIVFYLHKDEIHLVPKIKRIMEDWEFSIPIVADICVSTDNWANKRELNLAA